MPTTDPITRDCDGTKQQGTRNCPDRASWNLRAKDSKPWIGACNRHLAQVGTSLLEGEQGDLDVRRIRSTEH